MSYKKISEIDQNRIYVDTTSIKINCDTIGCRYSGYYDGICEDCHLAINSKYDDPVSLEAYKRKVLKIITKKHKIF